MSSEYEKLRLKNLQDNKRILAQLGISNPFSPLGRVVHKPVKRKSASITPKTIKKTVHSKEKLENYGSERTGRRRSRRLQGKEVPDKDEVTSDIGEDSDEDDEPRRIRVQPGRENFFGAVEGVEIGTIWQTRLQSCAVGVHRPTVAGIHGSNDGAYSIALSGGYEDDVDLGDCFTYTGEGGRDLKGTKSNPKNLRTAAQSKDQTLTRGNFALSRNVELGHPVRVIRGYKLRSPFAPAEGYRYDGLYTVEKYWFTTGMSGFGVWKFAMRRVEDQAPPPWTIISNEDSDSDTEKKEVSDGTKIPPPNLQRSDSGIESDTSSQKSDDAEES